MVWAQGFHACLHVASKSGLGSLGPLPGQPCPCLQFGNVPFTPTTKWKEDAFLSPDRSLSGFVQVGTRAENRDCCPQVLYVSQGLVRRQSGQRRIGGRTKWWGTLAVTQNIYQSRHASSLKTRFAHFKRLKDYKRLQETTQGQTWGIITFGNQAAHRTKQFKALFSCGGYLPTYMSVLQGYVAQDQEGTGSPEPLTGGCEHCVGAETEPRSSAGAAGALNH